ncbi:MULTISPECIES: patatin family protein [unclassified Nocardia]|uniref:patatin-like phospholipase family protein n=1 Tax=unclassified Nocardia TaxID=2637762 RepID=UPI00278C7B97|nr:MULTISPECIES: patatin family protein [unclassified Nocardia]
MTVAALIAQRHRDGSRPGARTDDARLALVIEGGSTRGAYSHGMVTALEQLGLTDCFDAVYGASAGALNGAWLLCGRAADAWRAWHPTVINRVISPARALRGGPVVDTRFLVHSVYAHIVPMDFPAILANPITFHPIATDTADGAAVDLHPYLTDPPALQRALRATTCLPILAGRSVRLGDRSYVDAGLSESVPARTAFARGATHALVLRTRRADEPPTIPSRLETRTVARFLSRHAPGTVDSWLIRGELQRREESDIAANPAVLQIRPPAGSPSIGRIGRDATVIRRALDLGREAVIGALAPHLPARLASGA